MGLGTSQNVVSYMNLDYSLCRIWKGLELGWGAPILKLESHPTLMSAFPSWVFSTCPVTLGFEGGRGGGLVGQLPTEPPEVSHWLGVGQ